MLHRRNASKPSPKDAAASRSGHAPPQLRDARQIELITPTEAAEYLKVSARTLARWRITGDGPPFRPLSSQVVRYDRTDLCTWLENRVSRSTLEAADVLRTTAQR